MGKDDQAATTCCWSLAREDASAAADPQSVRQAIGLEISALSPQSVVTKSRVESFGGWRGVILGCVASLAEGLHKTRNCRLL